ncbi:MAG TPA: AI-2E family transporter [Bacteroidales bacterium]|nr:AI-2E family transporter [Bacteroidales bacterium]
MLKPPDLSRVNNILLFTVLTGIVLYYGREFFILISFSGFLAMLMAPVSNVLERHHFNRIFSSIISVLIIVAFVAVIVSLLSTQVVNVSDDFPQIKDRLEESVDRVQSWINNSLGINSDTLMKRASQAMSNVGGFITGIVKGTFSFIGGSFLVLVFTFLFLLQREKYEKFVIMLHPPEKRDEAKEVIFRISRIAQHYLAGRLISILFLSILYFAGFALIGLKNALLLSVLAAIVTFIPYIGPFVGGFIPFFMAIVSGSMNKALLVVAIISVAQLLDNYFIEPYVVGGSVNISPFFAIFILILGGVVWGISGVILFLPLLGILKIIFENTEGLKSYAYLIGDQRDSTAPEKIWQKIKNLFSRKKKS